MAETHLLASSEKNNFIQLYSSHSFCTQHLEGLWKDWQSCHFPLQGPQTQSQAKPRQASVKFSKTWRGLVVDPSHCSVSFSSSGSRLYSSVTWLLKFQTVHLLARGSNISSFSLALTSLEQGREQHSILPPLVGNKLAAEGPLFPAQWLKPLCLCKMTYWTLAIKSLNR